MKKRTTTSITHKKPDQELVKKRKTDADATENKMNWCEMSIIDMEKPLTGFFFFMEEFRKEYIAGLEKAGRKKWRSMADTEKAPYVKKSVLDYFEKVSEAIHKKQHGGEEGTGNESNKSTFEIHDEEKASVKANVDDGCLNEL